MFVKNSLEDLTLETTNKLTCHEYRTNVNIII